MLLSLHKKILYIKNLFLLYFCNSLVMDSLKSIKCSALWLNYLSVCQSPTSCLTGLFSYLTSCLISIFSYLTSCLIGILAYLTKCLTDRFSYLTVSALSSSVSLSISYLIGLFHAYLTVSASYLSTSLPFPAQLVYLLILLFCLIFIVLSFTLCQKGIFVKYAYLLILIHA